MCGTVLRGAVALPGSKATSRAKGSYRNLGDLISDPLAMCLNGPCREGEEPTPAMYGGEKSDRAVAMKPASWGLALGRAHKSATAQLSIPVLRVAPQEAGVLGASGFHHRELTVW
jgi:hypothetical protein